MSNRRRDRDGPGPWSLAARPGRPQSRVTVPAASVTSGDSEPGPGPGPSLATSHRAARLRRPPESPAARRESVSRRLGTWQSP